MNWKKKIAAKMNDTKLKNLEEKNLKFIMVCYMKIQCIKFLREKKKQ